MNNGYKKYVKKIQQKTIFQINDLVKKKEGKWINSKEYNGIDFVCELTCKNSHSFTLIGRSVRQGSWCPYCLKNINIGETFSRMILENLLGYSLCRTRRISGLKDPKTKQSLEIDGFNLSKMIGFEYQGNQHYKYIPYIHKNKKTYKDQITKDKIKKDFFKKKKWKLIIIRQFKSFDIKEMSDKIITLLKKNNITFKHMSLEELSEKTKGMYEYIKNKELEKIASRKKPKRYTEEKAQKVCLTYQDLTSFIKENNGLSQWMKRQGLYYKLTDHMTINSGPRAEKWTLDELKELALKYTLRTQFKLENWSAWRAANKMEVMDQICSHMEHNSFGNKHHKKYSDQFLINYAKNFETRSFLRKCNFSIYNTIIKRKLADKAFAHMKLLRRCGRGA